MNAVLGPARDNDQAFFDSQMLPPDKRGVSFEALFYRQLQQVTIKIHETENVDQIMLEASQDICRLFNADRLTLYAVNEDRSAIVSKVKTGLNTSRDLKLPISAQSIAGYVAFSRQDAEHGRRLRRRGAQAIHPDAELPEGSGQALRLPHQADAGAADRGRAAPARRAAGHQQQERPAFRRARSGGRQPAVQDARHRDPPAHAEGRRAPPHGPPSTTAWWPTA